MQYRNLACALVLALAVVAPAVAEMTEVLPPCVPGELSHEEILEAVYSVDFVASGMDFFSPGKEGGISAIRFDDELTLSDVLDVVVGQFGTADDQVWGNGDITATAMARYASYTQQFGYDAGEGFVVLFDVSGSGTKVDGSATVDLIDRTWAWGRGNSDGTNRYYSEIDRNRDGLDHMVTYRINGLDTNETVWMLFWEDLPGGHSRRCASDRDFNDLAVEIRAVPEPATLFILAAGLPLIIRRKRA